MARRPLRLIPAGALLLAVTLAGCGGGAPAPDSAEEAAIAVLPSTAPVPVGAPVEGPADTVALTTVRAVLSWDTRVDTRPNDTVRRLALGWLTPGLRRETSTFAGDSAPGAEWDEWTRRHARADVDVRLGGDEHPPDTTSAVHRQVHAIITLRGDGGWTTVQRRTLFLRLALTGGFWRVDEITAVQGP